MSVFRKKAVWIGLEGSLREEVSKDPVAGAEQVRRIVSNCAEMGFNLIFPCVRTHDGATAYRSRIEKNYYGWDVLAVLCETAAESGIEIHPWFCFWGDGGRAHPELHGIDDAGKVINVVNSDCPTLCPLRPESQQYMLSLVEEIIEQYPADGFHLDYIRYMHSPCYCDYHRDQFRSRYGRDPVELDENSELWDEWNRFNADGLTDFVGRISAKVRSSGKKVSAALFPTGRHEIDTPDKPMVLDRIVPSRQMHPAYHVRRFWAIFQDWSAWCRKGYLDYAAIMQYTPRLDVVEETARSGPAAAEGAEFIMGLGLIWGQTIQTLIPQIQLCARKGLAGVCLFDYFNLVKWSESDRRKIIDTLNE